MKQHDVFLELAAAAIDFPLTGADRSRLEQHLAGCHACSASTAGMQGDALAMQSLPPVTLPDRRAAEILGTVLDPHVVRHPLRLLAVAALLGLMLIGTLVAGGELLRETRDRLVVVLPLPSGSPAIDAGPTAAPSGGPASPEGVLAVTVGDPAAGSWVSLLTLGSTNQVPLGLGFGADPAWGPDGLLVYACGKAIGENTTICTLNAGATGVPQPEIASDATHPAPAPDGATIAVRRGMIDVGETWLMDADGGNQRLLSMGSFLQWSPDGRWLLGQPESETPKVAVIGADGEGFRILADPGKDPTWSPNGQRVAYVVVEGDTRVLRQLDVSGGGAEDLYTAPAGSELSSPAYLPDGGWVFVQDGNLWRLQAGSGQNELVQLTTGLAIPADVGDEVIDLSPDGRWIAFTTGSGADARVGIAAVDGSGSQMLDIPDIGTERMTQPRWAPASVTTTTAPLGTTWTAGTVPTNMDRPVGRMEAVTSGPPFVAVGSGCNGQTECEAVVWTSADGRSWERAPASNTTDLGSVFPSSGPVMGMFDVTRGATGYVAIGYAARPEMQATVWFSPDSVTWRRIALGSADRVRLSAVTWNERDQAYVIVGEDRPALTSAEDIATAAARAAVWTSADGITWTQVPHTDALDAGDFIDTMEDPLGGGMHDVVAGPNGLVAVGSVCRSTPKACDAAAWASIDGITWERVTAMPTIAGGLWSVAASEAGYVAVGSATCQSADGACPALVMTSPDGRTWTRQPFEGKGDLQTVTEVGGRFLATFQFGPEPVWASDDGTSWAPAEMQGGPSMAEIADSRFAASDRRAVWIGAINDVYGAWVSPPTEP